MSIQQSMHLQMLQKMFVDSLNICHLKTTALNSILGKAWGEQSLRD